MLRTSQLTYQYDGENAPSLTFPDIECETGAHWLLLGQSGSGKTTLLHLLAGMRTPTSGSIDVNGTDITKLSSSELDSFRGRNIGVIFQRPHFVRSLNVFDNIALARSLAGMDVKRTDILELLERLNIGHKVSSNVSSLSVGEQQRVAIARAIINQPTVILADEPTSALDDINTDEVLKLINDMASQVDAKLLIVTHDNRLKSEFENQIRL
jgi:putative ABC transport system ATP-binding protein